MKTTKAEPIKLVIKIPGKRARIADVPYTLGDLQRLVGGYVQELPTSNGKALLFDEEGQLKGLAPNVLHPSLGPIVGPVLVVQRRGHKVCLPLRGRRDGSRAHPRHERGVSDVVPRPLPRSGACRAVRPLRHREARRQHREAFIVRTYTSHAARRS